MGKHVNKPPKGPDDGKVGYRKPPKDRQFPKGKSGNPKGRPPGSKGLRTDLRRVLANFRTVERDGKTLSGTTQFLMLDAMALRGSLGDVRAFAALLPYIVQAFGFEDRDVDNDRLSPGDEAILYRLLGRFDSDAGKPESQRSTGAKRTQRKRASPSRSRKPGTDSDKGGGSSDTKDG
jgi:hypothetical protein